MLPFREDTASGWKRCRAWPLKCTHDQDGRTTVGYPGAAVTSNERGN